MGEAGPETRHPALGSKILAAVWCEYWQGQEGAALLWPVGSVLCTPSLSNVASRQLGPFKAGCRQLSWPLSQLGPPLGQSFSDSCSGLRR